MKTSISRSRRVRRLAAVGAGALFALAPIAAHAAPDLDLEYDATGSSYIAKTNSTVLLGPTILKTHLDLANGAFTGSLPLPGTQTHFSVAGFIPVDAKVAFVEAAPLTGQVSQVGQSTVANGTAKYYIKLSNIKIVGFPTFTGSKCQTKDPVTIPVGTPTGGAFNLETGGELTGTYSIGKFANCGLNTGLINALVPGGGNTVNIEVSNGRLQQ